MLGRQWKGDQSVFELLRHAAANDKAATVRQTALQELAQGWAHDRGTVETLKVCDVRDDSKEVRWTALQELGSRWKDDSEVQRFLSGVKASHKGV